MTSAIPRVHACTLKPERSLAVVSVPSADTLPLHDGTSVVLIGALPPINVDAPTAISPPPWPPAEVSREALEAMTRGQSVGLAFTGNRRDRYGRHLAHVFLLRDGQRIWVQANLIANGYARAYAVPGNTACLEDLLDHERSARAAKSGHWATGIFQDRDAHDRHSLARYHDTFQTIEGRIDRVGKVNGHTVLDFHPDHRSGFSVWLPPRDAARNRDAPVVVAGQRVRVRGWIEFRRTPRLTLSTSSEIEPLDPAANQRGAEQAN